MTAKIYQFPKLMIADTNLNAESYVKFSEQYMAMAERMRVADHPINLTQTRLIGAAIVHMLLFIDLLVEELDAS